MEISHYTLSADRLPERSGHPLLRLATLHCRKSPSQIICRDCVCHGLDVKMLTLHQRCNRKDLTRMGA